MTSETAGDTFVLDASALLAYLLDEPGSETVQTILTDQAVINTVNYAEVLTRLTGAGETAARADRRLRSRRLIGGLIEVVPVTEADAVVIAQLRASTRAHGLSLGDRACLATALRLDRAVMTADRAWATLDVGPRVHLIRTSTLASGADALPSRR